MQVSTNKLKRWKANLDQGDKTLIQKYTGVSQPTIAKAFKGEAKQTLIKMIDLFFEQKAKQLQSK